jgi:MFS family permease
MTRQQLLRMFTMLYFVQGVIQAYQLNFFKPHMASAGIDTRRIGLVASLALLPFVLKFIYGIISDRYNLFGKGHRAPYMFIGLVGTATAFFGAYFVDPSTDFGVLAAVVLSATFMMALFDTAADAYAVDVMEPEDHSVVQAYMTGGRAIGLIALSAVFGFMVDRVGYQPIFLVIGALLLIPLFQVSRVRESVQRSPGQSFDWAAFRVMKQPKYLLFGLFLIGSWTVFQGIDGLVTFYLSEEFAASGSMIGAYGTLKGIGMVVGAWGVAKIVHKLGHRTAALITLAVVTGGGLLIPALGSATAIIAIAAIWGIGVGLQWTTYATFSMDVTDLRIAGSMFAILGVMSNIGLGLGEAAIGFTETYGIATVFRFLALGNLLLIPLIIKVLSMFTQLQDPVEAAA